MPDDNLKELAKERQRQASEAGAAGDPYHHGASAARVARDPCDHVDSAAGLAFASRAPPSRLLRRRDVERLTGLSRSGVYMLMAKETFPKPVSLGPKSVAWVETEIRQWIAERIAQRDQAAA